MKSKSKQKTNMNGFSIREIFSAFQCIVQHCIICICVKKIGFFLNVTIPWLKWKCDKCYNINGWSLKCKMTCFKYEWCKVNVT